MTVHQVLALQVRKMAKCLPIFSLPGWKARDATESNATHYHIILYGFLRLAGILNYGLEMERIGHRFAWGALRGFSIDDLRGKLLVGC
jgi:hypothetical protein